MVAGRSEDSITVAGGNGIVICLVADYVKICLVIKDNR